MENWSSLHRIDFTAAANPSIAAALSYFVKKNKIAGSVASAVSVASSCRSSGMSSPSSTKLFVQSGRLTFTDHRALQPRKCRPQDLELAAASVDSSALLANSKPKAFLLPTSCEPHDLADSISRAECYRSAGWPQSTTST